MKKSNMYALLLAALIFCGIALPVSANDKLTHGDIIFKQDFSEGYDNFSAQEGLVITVGSECTLEIIDEQLVMSVQGTSSGTADLFVDYTLSFPEKFVFSYRYMIEKAVDGEGSVACFILYPNESQRVLNNANYGSKYAYTDGAAEGNATIDLETKIGVWYTLYTAIDQSTGNYSMYRIADGDENYTVICEDMQLQTRESAPLLRLMTQRNSDAAARFDDVIIREYDPDYVYVEPETIAETSAESNNEEIVVSAPKTADVSVLIATVLCACGTGTLMLYRKKK